MVKVAKAINLIRRITKKLPHLNKSTTLTNQIFKHYPIKPFKSQNGTTKYYYKNNFNPRAKNFRKILHHEHDKQVEQVNGIYQELFRLMYLYKPIGWTNRDIDARAVQPIAGIDNVLFPRSQLPNTLCLLDPRKIPRHYMFAISVKTPSRSPSIPLRQKGRKSRGKSRRITRSSTPKRDLTSRFHSHTERGESKTTPSPALSLTPSPSPRFLASPPLLLGSGEQAPSPAVSVRIPSFASVVKSPPACAPSPASLSGFLFISDTHKCFKPHITDPRVLLWKLIQEPL